MRPFRDFRGLRMAPDCKCCQGDRGHHSRERHVHTDEVTVEVRIRREETNSNEAEPNNAAENRRCASQAAGVSAGFTEQVRKHQMRQAQSETAEDHCAREKPT